ncbi:MAG: exodeoxyribonuclease V subunit gamma [Gemmatimonadetes bacterium]|nr:exodeoxyribonuclease V subunit gamma [Gemmatimonadota bacterium]
MAELEGRGAAVQRVGEVPNGAGVLERRLQRELATDDAGTTRWSWRGATTPPASVHDAHGDAGSWRWCATSCWRRWPPTTRCVRTTSLLLVPDAAEWALTVDAVFGVRWQGALRLPYRIADRLLHARSRRPRHWRGCCRWKGAAGAECRARCLPHLRQAGGGAGGGRREWVESALERANVRWGYDGAARSAPGFPDYEEASWRAGPDRLPLGRVVVWAGWTTRSPGCSPKRGTCWASLDPGDVLRDGSTTWRRCWAQWRHERSPTGRRR